MNYIWAGMLGVGVFFAIINHRLSEFTEGLMTSCTKAVYFVIGLMGIMAVWSGIMNIAKETGLIDLVAKKVKPLMKFLFREPLQKDTTAMILMSFTANVFGAGNSATVFAIKSMEMLDKENGKSKIASNAMCMFISVNMSMVQLVPITVLKIRSDVGSVDSGSIIIPSILAGSVGLVASIIVCKYYERKDARCKGF